jgi:hypothetical protein
LKRNAEFARLAVLLAAAILLAALLGCKSQVSGDVMATVDGRKIFRSDVDKYYDNQVASAQQAPTGEQATILRLNILRRKARSARHRGGSRPKTQRDQVPVHAAGV